MRAQGALTNRHLLVGVLVVLVVNAQLTWWIIYFLRENRSRLDLERAQITAACRAEAARVTTTLDRAQRELEIVTARAHDQLTASRLPLEPLPSPFTAWVTRERLTGMPGWSIDAEGDLQLEVPCSAGTCAAAIDRTWARKLLEVADDLEVVGAAVDDGIPGTRPAIDLPPPFADRTIRPTSTAWHDLLRGYRGRIKMMVSEGAFFAALLLVMVGLLWKTLRREVELEKQHRNFLSAITHELKSPLAAMHLSLETVLRGRADSTASMRFLENALQDTERLQSLVQKVLEVTRYGRGHGSLRLVRANVSSVVEEAVDIFARRATASGAQLEIDLEPGIWGTVDPEALAIVVSNLLENALKYGGAAPRVRVALELDDDTALLDIEDNGQGIPPDEEPFIFDRFYRAGDEMTRTSEGTGLGLYLVRQIVHAHHGAVTVASSGPSGSTFRVTLPEAEVREDAP
jgi:signal transduction histidine kinase